MGQNDKTTITVTVVSGTALHQATFEMVLPQGSTVRDAVNASGILMVCPGISLDNINTGIFGNLVSADRPLRDGDRVEIYRPLASDPNDLRFRRSRSKKD